MLRMLTRSITIAALAAATPALADTYTKAIFSGGTFGGGANLQSPFSGNGFFPGQTFSGSFVFDNNLIPAAGSGYVNVFGNSFPDYANIPAADLFTFNFGPLTFNAASPAAVQYNNGNFNGFFYVSDFAFQGGNYQLQIQGGSISVVALDNQGNPGFNSLVNGYINIGNNAVTDQAPYVPVVAGGAVPEPATWAMLIFGFAGIAGSMRHRKAKVSFA